MHRDRQERNETEGSSVEQEVELGKMDEDQERTQGGGEPKIVRRE